MKKYFLRTALLYCVWPVMSYAEGITPPVVPTDTTPPNAFEQMLVHVYQENPKLNAERTTLQIADEKLSLANAGFRPNVSANLATGRQREKIEGQDWISGDASDASLVATQPIFSGFGTVAQKRAAEARIQAERAHLLSIEQSVLFTAISDWLDLCEKESTLALNNDNLKRLATYGKATQDRFKAGDGTQTDVAQAESRQAQAEARYAVSLAERDASRATFERDTGLMAHTEEFPSLPDNLPHSLDEAESLARNNPSFTQTEFEQQASGHDVDTAESSLWPKVFLRGSISEDRSPELGLETVRDDSLTINVSIPLYQGGAEYSKVREAKLAHRKTQQDAIDTSRGVLERAQLSWANYQSAQSVIGASQRALSASNRALDGVQEEQRQGLRTVTEVLDEQSERLSAQVSEAQAQKNVRLEAYRLLAATGQLTQEGLKLPVERYDVTTHYDDVAGRWAGL